MSRPQGKLASPILAFFALVIAFSLPFWILGAISPVALLPGVPLSGLGAVTPALAALILAYIQAGRAGMGRLLRRAWDVHAIRHPAWWLVIVAVNPLIAVAAYGVLRLAGQPLPGFGPFSLSALLLLMVLMLGALGEELGWTAFATEPLLQRWGTLVTGVGLGAFWAVWHWWPLAQVPRAVDWIAWWSLETLALRSIMVWFYRHAGPSVFAAVLFHALVDLCWQLFPVQGSYYDPRVFALITLGIAVVIYTGGAIYRHGICHAR